jgi:hypothetical protein
MKTLRTGDRHPLLMYRRTADRSWQVALVIGFFLLAIWMMPLLGGVEVIDDSVKAFLFVSAVVSLAISAFFFWARFVAYTQVYKDHLSLVTPFLRLNISYKRVRSAHPVLLQQLFPKNESSWSQRAFLEPFYGKTAVVIELKGYPMNPTLLRLFLPAQMFSPRTTGFVLLVPEWMKFSTELDTLQGKWLGLQNMKPNLPGSLVQYSSR